MANDENVTRAECAVVEHVRAVGDNYSADDDQDHLVDLLTNLRHWAKARDVNFGRALKLSGLHFDAEK